MEAMNIFSRIDMLLKISDGSREHQALDSFQKNLVPRRVIASDFVRVN